MLTLRPSYDTKSQDGTTSFFFPLILESLYLLIWVNTATDFSKSVPGNMVHLLEGLCCSALW